VSSDRPSFCALLRISGRGLVLDPINTVFSLSNDGIQVIAFSPGGAGADMLARVGSYKSSASEVADTIVRRTGEEKGLSQLDSMIFPSMSESYEYYSLKDLAGTLLA
jgi:hypothetical protein